MSGLYAGICVTETESEGLSSRGAGAQNQDMI